MRLEQARDMALELMREHGLLADGWTFKFDAGVKRFGATHWKKDRFTKEFVEKKITLARDLVKINTEERVRRTMLHEIAHALAGPHAGHGPLWLAKCAEVGIPDEKACYTNETTVTLPARWIGRCPKCTVKVERERLTKRNRNAWHTGCGDREHPIQWTKNPERVAIQQAA